LLGGLGGGSLGGLLGGLGGSSSGTGGSCTPNGQQSVEDGYDCCSFIFNYDTGNCIACTANGQVSVNGDGSDCCSDEEDNSGTCSATGGFTGGSTGGSIGGSIGGSTGGGACTPDGQMSTEYGYDCCSFAFSYDTGNCIPCTASGQTSVNGDGSDCCTGEDNASGVCF
jgi:hypothetical protein